MQEGYWKQHEMWDGTYTISDWFDIIFKGPEFKKEKLSLWATILKGFKNG